MAILSSLFNQALESVEPSVEDKANAPKAHETVRAALTSADELKEWGLDPVLIGSYKRNVSIRRVKDVDVFCRMDGIGTDVDGSTVLETFFEVLDAEFGVDDEGNRRVQRQARSVKIEFPEYGGLHVDAVPARARPEGYWEIPSRDGDWQVTNPEQLTKLKTEMNAAFDDGYVPLVKLVRQTRRTILGKHPGGLFVELALYDACRKGQVSKNDRTLGYVTALEAVAHHLDAKVAWGAELPDPTMPGQTLSFRATDNQWEMARDNFRAAASTAREAYEETDSGRAAVSFRRLLGKNGDDDDVFPMPDGYNHNGTITASATIITPGATKIPAGDRRFG